MKKYILFGILALVIPLAIYAQNSSGISTTTPTPTSASNNTAPMVGGCGSVPVSGQVQCLVNAVTSLNQEISALKARVAALESRATVVPGETAPICVFSSSASLKPGANSSDVLCLKQMLEQKGYKVETGSDTTFYDEATEKAVKQFQASQKLNADGIFGNKSKAAIQGKAIPAQPAIPAVPAITPAPTSTTIPTTSANPAPVQ